MTEPLGKSIPGEYLGDAVYAEYMPRTGMVRVYTTDGVSVRSEIYLEQETAWSLVRFLRSVSVALHREMVERHPEMRELTLPHAFMPPEFSARGEL